MSDEPTPVPEAQSQTRMVLDLTPEGRVAVTGPVENAILCYGLLEMARQAVYEYHNRKSEGTRIMPALFRQRLQQ